MYLALKRVVIGRRANYRVIGNWHFLGLHNVQTSEVRTFLVFYFCSRADFLFSDCKIQSENIEVETGDCSFYVVMTTIMTTK